MVHPATTGTKQHTTKGGTISIHADRDAAARIFKLEEEIENLRQKTKGQEQAIDARDSDLKVAEGYIDQLANVIRETITDLVVLPEVPLGGLPDSIEVLVAELREALM